MNEQTDKVTTSLLELLISAKNRTNQQPLTSFSWLSVRLLFCLMPKLSPISKPTLLLVQVLRLSRNPSLVFSNDWVMQTCRRVWSWTAHPTELWFSLNPESQGCICSDHQLGLFVGQVEEVWDTSHLDRNLAEMLRKLVLVLRRTFGIDGNHCLSAN